MSVSTNGHGPTQRWVLDASGTLPDEDLRAYCPMDDDDGVVIGLTVVTDLPPGPVVGVFHPDGQSACDEWVEENQEYVERIMREARGG